MRANQLNDTAFRNFAEELAVKLGIGGKHEQQEESLRSTLYVLSATTALTLHIQARISDLNVPTFEAI